jgi:hypothetical protein
MLYGDHHWASDLVSGALMGEAIGRSVADRATDAASHGRIEFAPAPLGLGLGFVGTF